MDGHLVGPCDFDQWIRWVHRDDEPAAPAVVVDKPAARKRASLSAAQAAQVVEFRALGERAPAIAKRFGVSPQTIRRIIKRGDQ